MAGEVSICDPFELPEGYVPTLDPPANEVPPGKSFLDTDYTVSEWRASGAGIATADYFFLPPSCDESWDGHTAVLHLARTPDAIATLRRQLPRPAADPRLLCGYFMRLAGESIQNLQYTLWREYDAPFNAMGPEPLIVRLDEAQDAVVIDLHPSDGGHVLLVAVFLRSSLLAWTCGGPDSLPCTGCVSIERAFGGPEPAGAGVVYFVQATAGGPIKIGTTSNVAARVAALQTANPARLRVLAATRGGPALERALHAAFAAHRLEGEWFAPAPELLRLIDELRGSR